MAYLLPALSIPRYFQFHFWDPLWLVNILAMLKSMARSLFRGELWLRWVSTSSSFRTNTNFCVQGCLGSTSRCCRLISGETTDFKATDACSLPQGVWRVNFRISSASQRFRLVVLDELRHQRFLSESQYSTCYNFPFCLDVINSPIFTEVRQVSFTFESPAPITAFRALIIDESDSINHVAVVVTFDIEQETTESGNQILSCKFWSQFVWQCLSTTLIFLL